MKKPNGFGSITKLSDKRRNPWRARKTLGWEDGKQIFTEIGYFKTRKEAEEALANFIVNPKDLKLEALTFKDIFKKWSSFEFPTLTENRQRVYNRIFDKCKTLHERKFKNIRHTDFSKIMDENTHANGIEIKNLFSKMSKFSLKNDIIDKDYSQFLEYRKKHEVKVERKIFKQNEIQILWDNVYKFSEVDTTLVMIYSGLRIGEIIGLEKKHIDWETKTIQGAGIKTEAGKNRIVPIHSKIFPLILSRYKSTATDYLFDFPGNNYGSKHQHYTRALDKFLKELKLPNHNAHDCRHTFATLLNNTDANGTAIKNIIGHSSFETTEKIYTHKEVEELIKAVEKIN